jgi:hypothetical protein
MHGPRERDGLPYCAGVRFLLASLHRAEYRRQVEAAGGPLDDAPDLVVARTIIGSSPRPALEQPDRRTA